MENDPLTYISEPPHLVELPAPTRWQRFSGSPLWQKIMVGSLLGIIVLLLGYGLFLSSPAGFPTDSVYRIDNGDTLSGVANDLAAKGVIRSTFFFKVFGKVFSPFAGIKAGDYELDHPQNAIALAWRFSRGSYNLTLERITIPEGLNVPEIAALFVKNKRFSAFSSTEFKTLATPYEGYLFPDTYLFLPNVTSQQVVDAMTDTYKKRIESLSADIAAFKRPIKDIIIMASIIEREARTEESRRTIAGILWKRLDQGMPLQVDAAFTFVNGKTDSKLITFDDLKIDSPYNTYVHKGLPPGPIGNPGLAAIFATVHPIKTSYYFYLSDGQGNMHYAVTHDGHVANKEMYLR